MIEAVGNSKRNANKRMAAGKGWLEIEHTHFVILRFDDARIGQTLVIIRRPMFIMQQRAPQLQLQVVGESLSVEPSAPRLGANPRLSANASALTCCIRRIALSYHASTRARQTGWQVAAVEACYHSRAMKAWTHYVSELIGTAALVGVGLSVVIFNFGKGSPVILWLHNAALDRLITGFLFGTVGALIAISPVGKTSGAHINPIVTMAFWAKGKMRGRDALGYVIAQCAGAVAGALPLVVWGAMGSSVLFGATVPSAQFGEMAALAGETVTTFAMVFGLFFMIGHPRLRRYTPLMFPPLYAVMVWLEAPISGTSTNPARSLGPSVVAHDWLGWWIYWAGPAMGALAAACAHEYTWFKRFEIEVAKVYHFSHDPKGIFRGAARGPSPLARIWAGRVEKTRERN